MHSAPAKARLAALRKLVDALNLKLVELIERRANLAGSIGKAKARAGLPAVDAQREREMLERVLDASRGAMPRKELERVFRAIFRASREIVQRERRRG